ncbi:hypothetical protein CVT26_004301 [Gymnopilus dilepis]|uniref:Uncharacterized protein n=1 Tax=Gymnopilus dilepis TaxID=231916 RepID=A0A409WYD2_9AGAR|nr:hypothetical protein CVT26_004301 [Gymnopilus dilepis]
MPSSRPAAVECDVQVSTAGVDPKDHPGKFRDNWSGVHGHFNEASNGKNETLCRAWLPSNAEDVAGVVGQELQESRHQLWPQPTRVLA